MVVESNGRGLDLVGSSEILRTCLEQPSPRTELAAQWEFNTS